MFNFIDFILGWILGMGSHRTDKDKSGIQHGLGKRKATVWGIGIGAASLAYNVYDSQTSKGGGGGGDVDFQYKQLPDYETSTGAREKWWETIQGYNAENNYGAMSPDWADVWDRAKTKVKNYYWGTATSPGLINKVKSSTSGRGVAESPAREDLIARMGIDEAGMLKDTAQQQAVSEAQFGENARMNWLQQMQGLSNQKPSYMTNVGGVPGQGGAGMGDVIGSGLGMASNLISKKADQAWYEKMMKEYGGGANLGSADTSTPGTIDSIKPLAGNFKR